MSRQTALMKRMLRPAFLYYTGLAITLLVAVCAPSSLYAQEIRDSLRRDSLSPTLLQDVLPVNSSITLRASDVEYPFDAPHANDSITMPLPSVPSGYIPPYYINPSPLFKGDYSTAGVILYGRYSLLYGSGNRSTLPGIGVQTEAGLAYVRQLSDRLYMQATVNATKLSMMHMTRIAAEFGGNLTYRVQDHFRINVFGGKGVGMFPNWTDWYYGGSLDFDLGERFSLELGV